VGVLESYFLSLLKGWLFDCVLTTFNAELWFRYICENQNWTSRSVFTFSLTFYVCFYFIFLPLKITRQALK
jgi:hypothetical protein